MEPRGLAYLAHSANDSVRGTPGRPASTGPRRQAGGETGGPGPVYAVQSSAHTNVQVRLPEHSGMGSEGLLSAPGPREALCRRPVSWP